MGGTQCGQRQRTPDGYCPVCLRFIGPLRRCPYCDVSGMRRPSARLLPALAILISGAGLAFTLHVARTTAPTTVSAALITPDMNFAHVRLTGTVTAPARIARNRSWAALQLDADNRLITLRTSATVTAALAQPLANLTMGSRISATGQLRINATSPPELYVSRVLHLSLERATQP